MRNYLLFIVALISFSLTFANSPTSVAGYENNVNPNYKNGYGQSYTFVENGITFSIFQNGEFDFYIEPRGYASANVNFGSVNISYNSGYNYDAYVQYDDYGAIVQIESLPIYYDSYGRVGRVGNIRINYSANRLVRIGNLRVYYNNYGYRTHYSGYINAHNRYYTYQPYYDYFVRPVYTRSVISHNPYRQYYNAERHYYKKGNKNHYKNNSYRHIENRVRVANSHNDGRRKYQEHKSKNDFSKRYLADRNSNKRVYANYNRNANTVSKRSNSHALNRSKSNRSQRTVANYKTPTKRDRSYGSNSRYSPNRSNKNTNKHNKTSRTVRSTSNKKYNNKDSKSKRRTTSRSNTARRSH